MKIKTTVIYIGLLLLLSSANTFAQDASISVGVKSWAANMSIDYDDHLDDTFDYKGDSDYTVLFGPSINIRKDKYFVGANYLTGSFKFPDFFNSGIEVNIDRSETDIFVGYYVWQKIALLAGYKLLQYGVYDSVTNETSTFDASGFVLGATGHYPLSEKSAIYVTYAFSDLQGDNIDSVIGSALDFGFASRLGESALSYSIGIKVQVYLSDQTDYKETDTFSGFTFALNYSI